MQPVGQYVNQPIAEILEQCRVRLAGGETIQSCLAAYPKHAAELTSLLPLVVQTRGLARDPDRRYAAAARRRFQASLAAAKQNQQRVATRSLSPLGWLARLAVPVALVLVLSLSGLGLVQASDATLPDSPLYPVKQASENVGQLLARTPPDQAAYQIRLANRRRMELEQALNQKKGPVLLLTVAQGMVTASNLATEQTIRSEGQARDEVVAHVRQLLTAEQHALAPLASDPHPQVAARARAFQQELAADEQKLAGK